MRIAIDGGLIAMVRFPPSMERSTMSALVSAELTRKQFLTSMLALTVGGMGTIATVSAQEPEAPPAPEECCPDITGCWTCGSWRSFCNSHHGKLRATIERCGCGYECHFSGTFFKIIGFRYTVPLTVCGCRDGKVFFSASKSIPFFGGTFRTSGWASHCKFYANYYSKKDRGVFEMSR